MNDVEDLLGRIYMAVIEGIYIISITDKNTFISETLELKFEQSQTYKKIYLSAEKGLTDGFIHENIKREIQQIVKEALIELDFSVQDIISSLKKKNQEQST